MPEREVRVLEWISTLMPECPTIGIVASVNREVGEWKAYVGAGQGQLSEDAEAAWIVEWGGPVPEAIARAADADGRYGELRYRK